MYHQIVIHISYNNTESVEFTGVQRFACIRFLWRAPESIVCSIIVRSISIAGSRR